MLRKDCLWSLWLRHKSKNTYNSTQICFCLSSSLELKIQGFTWTRNFAEEPPPKNDRIILMSFKFYIFQCDNINVPLSFSITSWYHNTHWNNSDNNYHRKNTSLKFLIVFLFLYVYCIKICHKILFEFVVAQIKLQLRLDFIDVLGGK